MEKHVITADNAQKIWAWMLERGGILVWPSVNLGNPGASWTTPARTLEGAPYPRPTWQAGDDPRHITDPAEIVVSLDHEVKRFRVALRMGLQGLQIKVTDAGSRRIREAVAKAGKGAYHVFDYETQEAVIMAPESQTPLADYVAKWRKEQESHESEA